MKDKNSVRKFSKTQLLMLLRDQEKEIRALQEQVAALEAQLEDRTIRIQECGSIAEAALQLTGIFEEAQKAANIYLESVIANHAGKEKEA